MGLLLRRLDRLVELLTLAARHADGAAGFRALLACYAATFRDPMSRREVILPLRVGAARAQLVMRASDIYTVAEIFRERQYALARPLGPAPVIVDAGANIGVAAKWFRLNHPDATLVAVEPVDANHDLLRRNFSGDARAVVVRAALAEAAGTVTMAPAAHGAEHAVREAAAGGEAVPALRLDALLAEHGIDRIDLLKLDVEGSEILALRGLGALLDRVGAIVAEVHEREIDVGAFYRLLQEHGFSVVRRRQYREGAEQGVHTMEAWREPA